MKALTTILLGTSIAATLALASDTRACGFVDYGSPRPAPRLPVAKAPPVVLPVPERIAAAEQRLEEERLSPAASEALGAFPTLRSATVGANPLETRGLRITAMAVVRSDGSLPGVRGFVGATEADRVANLEWAVSVLRTIESLRRDDPVAQADLGEALAKRPKYEAESFALLTDLAARDLVGSAHAYAALARLRSGHGDGPGADAATRRCQLMTKSPATVCRVDLRLAVGD